MSLILFFCHFFFHAPPPYQKNKSKNNPKSDEMGHLKCFGTNSNIIDACIKSTPRLVDDESHLLCCVNETGTVSMTRLEFGNTSLAPITTLCTTVNGRIRVPDAETILTWPTLPRLLPLVASTSISKNIVADIRKGNYF